jgi:hypothetical protein
MYISNAVIPNLGYEPGHLEVREKNWIMEEEGIYFNSARQDTSQKLEINLK